MQNIHVSEIMTRDPIIISPETNLLECAKKMVKKRVGSVLIVTKKKLVGFISRKDILWALIKKSKEDLSKIKAIDISPKKIATIKPTATISDVVKKMKKLKFDKLPVIQDKELVGVVTIRDILNFNPEIYPELDEFAKVREESKKLKLIEKLKITNVLDGICEECGNRELLHRQDGRLICDSCSSSM